MSRFTRGLGQVLVGLALVGVSGGAVGAAWEGGSEGVLSGKIASINPQQNMVKIKTGLFKRTEFVVNETSKISDASGAQAMRLEQLKPGDQVTVAFSNADGKRLVSTLQVNTASGQPAASPSPLVSSTTDTRPSTNAQWTPEQSQQMRHDQSVGTPSDQSIPIQPLPTQPEGIDSRSSTEAGPQAQPVEPQVQ